MFQSTNSQSTNRLFAIIVALYWLALVISTHLPGQHVPSQLDPVDKFLHFTAYAGLAFLILMATRCQLGMNRKWGIGLFCLLIVHGMIDEWTQGFVPGRFPSAFDAAADGIGAAIGITVFAIVQPILARIIRRANGIS